ncbi:MAG: DNA replication/repair protein RecF [Gammaproteobacteria bacterium]|nr:DNA replication/repair protein RecF [Gammaproteobacteria bacterium]
MAIEEIAIDNFRNLTHVRLCPSPHINLVVGKNGSGKTSFLEAIYHLGTARSFRTAQSNLLISMGAKKFTLYSRIKKAGVAVGVGISREKKQIKIKIGNHPISNSSKLAEILPVQLINPDVHKMMEDGSRYRRRFIEWGVFHVKPNYLTMWRQCTHILKQRNAALRHNVSLNELALWDDALCDISQHVNEARLDYIQRLYPYIDKLFSKISELHPITIALDQGWPEGSKLLDVLRDNRASDKKKGFTHYGPHRADLKIFFGNVKAKDIISRGQQKLVTALLKVAQTQQLLDSGSGSDPILLVDDLPAELDRVMMCILFEEITSLPIQSFITTTDLTSFPIVGFKDAHHRVFHVEHGSIE